MKSSEEQLKNRGYITIEDISRYVHFNKSELMELLKSKEPYKRTLAANLLSSKGELDSEVVNLFCKMLMREKKLYTKIELCNALSKAPVETAKIMVDYLGAIDSNQYYELPQKEFKKKNYPLPRDIIARTMAHMNVEVLPELAGVLKTKNITAIREAIDSIGFICFYNENFCSDHILSDLIGCFNEYIKDDIVRWKTVRAFEGFNSKTVIDILTNVKKNDSNEVIRHEAKRSLDIINERHIVFNQR